MKDYSELIDKICDGELTAEEQVAVDKLLQDDQDFVAQLEAQRDIIDHLYYLGKKEEMESYHQEYLNGNVKEGQVPRKTWLVAASLLLFLSAATFAYFNFIVPMQQPSVVSDDLPEEVQKELPENINLKIQQYQLTGAHDLQLTTEAGLKFRFPAGSIKDAGGNIYLDKFQLELIEVTDAQQISNIVSLQKNGLKRLPDQLIYLGLQNSDLNFNRLNPPGILNNYQVKYAEMKSSGMVIKSMSSLDLPVIKMDKEMQDYQRYRESKILLDSVEMHYALDGEKYHLEEGDGMNLDKAFVNEVKSFVKNYENNSAFTARVNQAQYCWSLYQKQHQLNINPAGKAQVINHYLPEQGWYAVWKE